MTPDEYNQRLHGTIRRICKDYRFISDNFGRCGSAETFVHDLAERWLRDYVRGKHKGKPPWITGRHKTRGGRDQDRWRRHYDRVKYQRGIYLAWHGS